MKHDRLALLIFTCVALPTFSLPLEARGAGGGRGYGDRGGYYRSPSMSREGYYQTESRGWGDQPVSRDQLSNYLQDSNANRFNPGGLNQRAINQTEAQQVANRAQEQFNQNYPNRNGWFNDGYYNAYGRYPDYYAPGVNWWAGAAWGGVAGWLAWDAASPAYYYDNTGVAVPVSSDTLQSSSQDYSSQPTTPVANNTTAPTGDWMPLGVFALGGQDNTGKSTLFLQLALNHNGDISGTYYNTASNDTYPVSGVVDKKTQQIALTMSNNPSSPIIQTGIYNLTQNSTPVMVHFPNGDNQVWEMVRVQGN